MMKRSYTTHSVGIVILCIQCTLTSCGGGPSTGSSEAPPTTPLLSTDLTHNLHTVTINQLMIIIRCTCTMYIVYTSYLLAPMKRARCMLLTNYHTVHPVVESRLPQMCE